MFPTPTTRPDAAGSSLPVSRRGWLAPAALFYALYWAAALLFREFYLRATSAHERQAPFTAAVAYLHADTPYQYRLLVPLLARGLHVLTHRDINGCAHLLTLLFTFALFVAFRRYLGGFLPDHFARFAALTLLYPLLWNYCLLNGYYFVSDVPAIFFFVLGLVLIREQRWGPYYVVFALATLNRETSCFLILAYLFTQWGRASPRQAVGSLVVQVALWLAIKGAMTLAFRANHGEKVLEPHFWKNLHWFTSDGNLFYFLRTTFGAVWLLIPLAWRAQPLFLRRLLWVVIIFFLGMSLPGSMSEIRIYNELIPILLAPALFSVYWLTDRDSTHSAAQTFPGPSL